MVGADPQGIPGKIILRELIKIRDQLQIGWSLILWLGALRQTFRQKPTKWVLFSLKNIPLNLVRCTYSSRHARPQIDRMVRPGVVGRRKRSIDLKTFWQESKLQILEFCADRDVETQPGIHLLALIDNWLQRRIVSCPLAMAVAGLEFAGSVKHAEMLAGWQGMLNLTDVI